MQLNSQILMLAGYGADVAFWVLMAVNIASMAIIAERATFFWRRRIDGDQFARHLLPLLRLHDLPRARAYLLHFTSPESTVLLAGLAELEHGRAAATAAMQALGRARRSAWEPI